MADTNGDNLPQTNGHTSTSPPPPQPQSAPQQQQPAPQSQSNPNSAPTIKSSVPQTSAQDPTNGSSKRPRDARLIHMLLSSLGITAYQERVPLQLLDFAYRHTSSILSDALHLSSDAYISQQTRARDAPPGGAGLRDADGAVTMSAVQLAIQSRLQYQFHGGGGGGLGKEFLLEMAETRNKVALPRPALNEWGVRLPNEKFVLSGVPWSLRDEWEGEEEEADEEDGEEAATQADVVMGIEAAPDVDGDVGGEDVEGGTAGDLFGDDFENDAMETEE